MGDARRLEPLPGLVERRDGGIDRGADPLDAFLVDRGEQRFLGREMAVERAGQHADRLDDLAHRRRREAALREGSRRFVEQPRQAARCARRPGRRPDSSGRKAVPLRPERMPVLERQTIVWSSEPVCRVVAPRRGESRACRHPRPPPSFASAPAPPTRSSAPTSRGCTRSRPNEQERALADLKVVKVEPGELLCRVGRPVTYWFGVIDGLLKMSNDTAMGIPITFTGLPPGGWFGEGTVIKREAYRYNIQALRKSTGRRPDASRPSTGCSTAASRSTASSCSSSTSGSASSSAAREIDRLNDPDARVARSLAALFHPVLYPGVGTLLRITQQELGYLVGLSRQRVNEALHALQARGLIRVEYGGVGPRPRRPARRSLGASVGADC